jgi:hypothetical protein
VYCHPLDEGWPAAAEVLEEVPVRRCARRGRAVDLVLDRARHNRSQFVFTEPHASPSDDLLADRADRAPCAPRTTRADRPRGRRPAAGDHDRLARALSVQVRRADEP